MSLAEQESVVALDSRQRVAPQLYEHLRSAIINLELPPGLELSRQELMARFGVSQTPIRDALMQLAEEGLISVYPQNGTVVSLIDTDVAVQAHFLRRAVELEVIDKLARSPDPALVTTLTRIVAHQELALEHGDLDDFDETDTTFHRSLYDAAGVPSVWTLVRRNSGHIDRICRLNLPSEGKARSVLTGHQEILSAISRARVELAREAVRAHLSGTLSQLDSIKQRFPNYMR